MLEIHCHAKLWLLWLFVVHRAACVGLGVKCEFFCKGFYSVLDWGHQRSAGSGKCLFKRWRPFQLTTRPFWDADASSSENMMVEPLKFLFCLNSNDVFLHIRVTYTCLSHVGVCVDLLQNKVQKKSARVCKASSKPTRRNGIITTKHPQTSCTGRVAVWVGFFDITVLEASCCDVDVWSLQSTSTGDQSETLGFFQWGRKKSVISVFSRLREELQSKCRISNVLLASHITLNPWERDATSHSLPWQWETEIYRRKAWVLQMSPAEFLVIILQQLLDGFAVQAARMCLWMNAERLLLSLNSSLSEWLLLLQY